MKGCVLVIAGSDSGGGAGIQADIKTIAMMGGHAATAITALTAQNSVSVFGIQPTTPEMVAAQIDAVLDDFAVGCVKTGMLVNADIIKAVADSIGRKAPSIPLIIDPVMISKSGAHLLAPEAVEILARLLVPQARLITPNIPEAEALLGYAIPDQATQDRAARDLLAMGAQAVLLKGGHMPTASGEAPQVTDVLATADGLERFTSARLPGAAPHGTGCTLASGIACGVAQGLELSAAIGRARDYLIRAMTTSAHGPQGKGSPLLDHGWPVNHPK